MAKRKNNNTVVLTPKKEKKSTTLELKSVKRPAVEESSDSDNDDFGEEHVNHAEAEETIKDDGQITYDPDFFRTMVESFNEFLGSRQSSASTVQNMERLVAEWTDTRREDNIDPSLFVNDYRKYLKHSIKFRNFQLNDACNTLLSYLGSDKSLCEFKMFPEKPLSKFQFYVKNKKIQLKGINDESVREAYRNMSVDEAGAREADSMVREASLKFIPKLQEFIDARPLLTEEQKRFINNKIKLLSKRYNPKEPATKAPKRKSGKKEAETAFSLFCRTKSDKYRDLSDEEREKKLHKKFAKLSTGERDLLESLALNSQ